MSLLNHVTVGLAPAPHHTPPEQITLTVEVSSARPTPEQLADALLNKLGVSAADRAALTQANGGSDLREQLIADLRVGGINHQALTYVGGGHYRGEVALSQQTRHRLTQWARTDGQAPAEVSAKQQELLAQARHQAELALRKHEAKQQFVAQTVGAHGARVLGAALAHRPPLGTLLLSAVKVLPPLAAGTGMVAGAALTLDKGLELGVAGQMERARSLPPAMMNKEQDEQLPVNAMRQPSAPAIPADGELPKGELVPTGEAPWPVTTLPSDDAKPSGMQPGPHSNPPGLERIVPPLATGASLGKLAADKAHEMETEKAAKPLNLTPTGDKDPAAVELAARIGGTSSVKIEGYGDREFDAVSDKYIGQTTNSVIATKSPSNYLNPSKKAQLRETLRVAAETGRTALFEFTAGTPSQEVTDFIERNAKRIGARYEVTVRVGGEK